MDEPRSDDDMASPHDGSADGKPGAAPQTPPPGADSAPPPDLAESLREIRDAGRAGLSAATDAAKALRVLVSADLSLARSAFGRALAFTGVAVAFGGSAWMLLMAATTALLHDGLGWSWTLSLGSCALLSVAVTAVGVWRAMHYFEHTRMQATRRQLARLGIGELADFMPEPGSHQSAEQAAEQTAERIDDQDGKPPKKKLGIDVTPP